MQQITIELDDDQMTSLQQFLLTQVRQSTDELTGLQRIEMIYPTAEAFLAGHIAQLMGGIAQQFPTEAVRQKMIAMRALQKEIEQMNQPKVALAEKL